MSANLCGEFMSRMSNPLLVPTWDGKTRVWVKYDQIVRMHKESCIFGPLAAIFGREVQQFLMVNPNAKIILMTEFQHSVDSGRVSVGQQRINWQWQREDAEMVVDDDQASQSSKRTRSPRRAFYRDVRHQEIYLQPARRG